MTSVVSIMGMENNNLDAETLFRTGNSFMSEKKYTLAAKSYLIAIKKHNHVFSMHNLGILYKHMNIDDKAENYFSMAIEQKDVKYLKTLASVFWKRKEYDKSEKYFFMAVEAEYTQNKKNLENNQPIKHFNHNNFDTFFSC